jgi:hypothetical protein
MKNLIVILFLFTSQMLAQTSFLVNTQTDTTQRDSHIARDLQGNYIIVWESENQVSANSQSDIYFQRFDNNNNKIGSETLVNNITENEQERPSLSMNSNGSFVIVWASHTGNFDSIFDIKGKLYVNNQQIGDEFLINSTTLNSQTKPTVSINNDGSFVVAWESWYQIDSKDVYLQRFDAAGNKIGEETLVNSTTNSGQGRPTIKHFNNGNFIVIWESWATLNDGTAYPAYDLYGKIYASNGSIVKDEFLVNTYTENYQWFADIETFDDLSFVVAWCSWGQDGHWGGIYLQKFGALGEKIGSEVLANNTTVNYQWLPKVRKTSENNIALVWSSWLQDGSREGVFSQIFDAELNKLSFETLVNEYTDNYQWEPDFIVTNDDNLLVTWSSWGEYDDYDIIATKITPTFPQGVIQSKTVKHTSGTTTSRFYVHVIDSTKINGNKYEITFDIVDEFNSHASIKNLQTQTKVVDNFPIDKGEDVFYLTDEFEGVAVQLNPTFTFALDIEKSYSINNSGHNINFSVGSGFGNKKLAPIDVVVVWGNTDTLSNGSFANPLDSAYNTTGKKVVKCPFYAWNLTDNEKMDLVIIEPSITTNLKWNPNEEVGIITPQKYSTSFPQYHASMKSQFAGSSLIMPSEGDSNFIFTQRPITSEDTFTFETLSSYITTDVDNFVEIPTKFELMQNYPNPFNPSTTIVFSVPKGGNVSIKIINILGQTVAELVNDFRKEGIHRVAFNASNIASGVYFYTIKYDNKFLSKKMLLVK